MNDVFRGTPGKTLAEQIAAGKTATTTPPPAAPPEEQHEPEPPREQGFGAYSLVNASSRHQQVSLELRFLAGDSEFFSYSHCYKARLNRSGTLVVTFSDDVVTIKGTNLLPVFKGIKDHRVGYVAESDPRAEGNDPKATLIDAITIAPRREPE
jgi:hypothetical protein